MNFWFRLGRLFIHYFECKDPVEAWARTTGYFNVTAVHIHSSRTFFPCVFILVAPERKCLEKHLCMSSLLASVPEWYTCFFRAETRSLRWTKIFVSKSNYNDHSLLSRTIFQFVYMKIVCTENI